MSEFWMKVNHQGQDGLDNPISSGRMPYKIG
jgi:hypothetical protein